MFENLKHIEELSDIASKLDQMNKLLKELLKAVNANKAK